MQYFLKTFIFFNLIPAFCSIGTYGRNAKKIIHVDKIKEILLQRFDIPDGIHKRETISKLDDDSKQKYISAYTEYKDEDLEEIEKTTVLFIAEKKSKSTYEFNFNMKLLANHTIDRVTLNTYSFTNSLIKVLRTDGLKKIEVARIQRNKSKWIKKNITSDFKTWIKTLPGKKHPKYVLKLKCKPEAVCIPSSKSLQMEVVFLSTVKKRIKRNNDCTQNSTTCCRNHVQINVKDLHWDDWLIAPQQFDYYYCVGSCENSSKKSIYETIVSSSTNDVAPCCTPVRKQGLNIMYTEGSYAWQKVIPDLMAAECGCAE